MRAVQKFAKWRWGPPLFLGIEAVFLYARPVTNCGGNPWWSYVLPVVVFAAFYVFLMRRVRRTGT